MLVRSASQRIEFSQPLIPQRTMILTTMTRSTSAATFPRAFLSLSTAVQLMLLCSIQTTTALTSFSGRPRFQLTTTALVVSPQQYSTTTTKILDAVSFDDDVSTTETRVMDQLFGRTMFLIGVTAVVGTSIILSLPEASNALEQVPLGLYSGLPTATTATPSLISSAATGASNPQAAIEWGGIIQKASQKALGGGKAGASAAVVQVLSLMWLRTSMNRQYRYGGDLQSSLKALWEEGGIPRLYQGLPFALIQGPLTRFGDTAANVGVLALLETIPETQSLPLFAKTAVGSIVAGTWRILLMPIDASKTAMQVEGAPGLQNLYKIAREEGPGILYQGAVAQAAATAVGHFPWYLTYNFLNDQLPAVVVSSSENHDLLLLSLARSALLGLCSSCVSDVCSNSLRVIKTTKQTARLGKNAESQGGTTTNTETKAQDLSYTDIVKGIIEQDGLQGLFGRGLKTRLLTNAIQGAVFSVLWRYFQQAGGS